MEHIHTIEQVTKPSEKNDFIDLFKNSPNEDTREFEMLLTLLAIENTNVFPLCQEILDDRNQDQKIRYAAFFTLCNYHRRYKNPSKYNDLLESHRNEFQSHSTYNHLYSMFLQQRNKNQDLIKAIYFAEESISKAPKHPGFLHNFSHAVVTAVEEGVIPSEQSKDQLALAKKYLKSAIQIEPDYAKFYCTKGRLLAIQGFFVKAKGDIRIAIDKEDSLREDYALRITDYQSYLMRIQLQEVSKELGRKLKDTSNELLSELQSERRSLNKRVDQERVRSVEFLGFFTAVISLIIGGIQISQRQDIVESAQLMIVFTGTLLIAFSSLSFLLNGMADIKRSAPIFFFGMITCAMGLLFIPKIL
ncbi:MAG: hypothetical protein QNJ55_15690 [Xenococcus sp. MO_188.B8]|nr:hypothetical protein [Xenococcus sp. MO_188.B8]